MSKSIRKFSVGDKVIVNHVGYGIKDVTGVIVELTRYDTSYAVEMEGYTKGFTFTKGKDRACERFYAQNLKHYASKTSDGKFKIGDRVVVKDTGRSDAKRVDGKHGVIVKLNDCSKNPGIKFDEKIPGCHDLDGATPNGYGWWVSAYDLELEKKEEVKVKEKKIGKFSVGDKVMFRYWDDMAEEFKRNSDGGIDGPNGFYISPSRNHLCGRTAIVDEIKQGDKCPILTLKDWSSRNGDMAWTYGDWMFRLVEKAKVAPKKQLTVAEIEKALGYSVEVIKEGK